MRLALLLLIAVCAAACLPLRAVASVPCLYPRPTASDGINLRVAVRNAAGTRASRLVIQNFCGFNADGQADLQSPFAYLTQGVREWMTIHCQRQDATNWHCEPLVMHRGTKLHATVGGNDQVVDAEFPTEMPAATARDLVLRAVSVMEAAAGPTRCEKPVDRATSFAERPWSQQHSDVLYQAGQSPFVVTAWVEEDFAGGRTLVWFSDSLGIELPSGCWLEWPALIVT